MDIAMHNCFGEGLYQKDVEKILNRWKVHPDYAVALNRAYQNFLSEIETFMDAEAKLMPPDNPIKEPTGRSRAESAALTAGLLSVIKAEARSWLDSNAAVEETSL
jgi:hypothetical protein